MTTQEWIKDKLAFLAIVLVAVGAFLLAALLSPLLIFPGVRRWLNADGIHESVLEQRRRAEGN